VGTIPSPVSVTLKKNVIVITASPPPKSMGLVRLSFWLQGNQVVVPSVRLSAIRNSAKGGIPKRALSVAKAAARKTNGAIILKIWGTVFSLPSEQWCNQGRRTKALTRRVAIRNGLNLGTSRYTGSK